MGTASYVKGVLVAVWTGVRHIFHPRMTLKYPEQKLDLEGPGYKYDPRTGTGLPGFKGRHILYFDKCTGCQLCAIACDGVAVAIEMQHVPKGKAQNKKEIWPAVDYGRCVPPSTQIITSDGTKPISEVHVGDRVLTHTGKFRKVTRLFKRNYTGKLYTFRTLGNPEQLTTTEDHPILVYGQGRLSWVYANEVNLRTYMTRPVIEEESSREYIGSTYRSYHSAGEGSALITELLFPQPRQPRGIIVSPVVHIETENVQDFEVRNLEVEEDNSYVAANQSVHNCVFCGLCVEPDTPVMTNPGLKPISEINVGEMVLTHTGAYRPVTKVWDMRYTGPLYRIQVFGKPEPLVCTADHQLMAVSRPVSTRKDRRLLRVTRPLRFYTPAELKRGDYLVAPIVKNETPLSKHEEDIPFGGQGQVRRLALDATPDLFRLIGYYVSEGVCSDFSVYFSFHRKERKLVGDCQRLLKAFFGRESPVRPATGKGVTVVISSVLAVRFFSQFGRGAENKHLTDWVFFAEKPKLVQLLKGIWLGDGCVVKQPRQKYLKITTVSKTLAYQLQHILAKLEIIGSLAKMNQRNRLPAYHLDIFGKWSLKLAQLFDVDLTRRHKKFNDRFDIDDNFVYLPIRKIENVTVEGYRVMDVSVSDVQTFAPLGLASHNCVDACPFDALFMTNDYELSAYDKPSLKYTPDQLAIPPKTEGFTYRVKIDPEKGTTTHG